MATKMGMNKNVDRRGAFFSAVVLAALAGTPVALGQNSNTAAQPAATAPAGQPGTAPAAAPTAARPAESLPSVLPPSNFGEEGEAASAEGDENMVVDLHVNDEDLGNVLEMLSLQSKRNIIASKGVSARVTANLYGVTFHEALEAILHANGYTFIENGNFIYIYTIDEMAAIEKAQRQLVSKVIRLNYLTAVDAAEFVKPLLSETGQIKTNGKTTAFPSVGEVPVGSDEYANTSVLVIVDFDENVAEVEKMVRELDTRPAQVLVEATILQTRLNEANAFGVDFSVIGSMDFGEFFQIGGPLQAADALIGGRSQSGGGTPFPGDGNGNAVVSSPGNTAGPGTLKIGVVEGNVGVFVRLLDQVTDATVLSNPKVLALNRMPARVLVGRKVGYISTTSTDTATTQTVQFLDTGTQLYFRPFITNEGKIRMELKPSVSEAQIRDVRNSTGASVTIPDEITNQLTTNVIVGDGQTIVLGGLFRESTSTTRTQVPVLGDIPVVGAAFRGNDDQTERQEIIFLITPSIVNDDVLVAHGQRGSEFIDRVRTGSRAGLLPWSRDRLTGNWNVDAERLASEGNTDAALWKLQQSLWLSPNQPDALAMKERLSGNKKPTAGRSMLEEIIHGEGVVRRGKSRHVEATPEFQYDQPSGRTHATVEPRFDSSAQASDSTGDSMNNSMPNQGNWSGEPNFNTPSHEQADASDNWTSASEQWNGQQGMSEDRSDQDTMDPRQFASDPQDFGANQSAEVDGLENPYIAQAPQGAPAGSGAGFFMGAFRWIAAFHAMNQNSNDSTFTNAQDEPMTENE